jgi:cytochrome c oxidase subunit 3
MAEGEIIPQGHTGQFATSAQRARADTLGMWLFLATEVMMFGGLFLAITVYRWLHPAAAREAAHHLHMWIGAFNTGVLLTSSCTMAQAHAAARQGDRRAARAALVVTAILGTAFLATKAFEYSLEIRDHILPGLASAVFQEPQALLFINLYYIATGLHGVHLSVGIAWVAALALRRRQDDLRIGLAGLYWHFVDAVWVFLYPALYLIGRAS